MSDLLIELVRRYSPSTNEAEAVSYLVDWMQGHDFHAYIDAVGNACGSRGDLNAPNTLMLLGHIDTYPGEIPVRVENGILYGRGSVDAKGSLCTFAEATAAATIPDGWRVVVVGAVEEEITTSKGAHFIAEQFSPSLCIIGEPSGLNRLTLGYKGRLIIDYYLSRPIAHTARPEPSVGELGFQFWQRIAAWAAQQNAGREKAFDQIMPHLRNIHTDSDHFCDTLRMTVSFRLPTDFTPQTVLDIVQTFAEPDGQIEASGMEQAYQGDRNNALVRGMLAAMRTHQLSPGFVLKTGTSDMNVVAPRWNCPAIAYGPGDSNLDHTPQEHLVLSEYETAIRVLRHFIESLSQ